MNEKTINNIAVILKRRTLFCYIKTSFKWCFDSTTKTLFLSSCIH